jgi:two-component system cell cycle response regulator
VTSVQDAVLDLSADSDWPADSNRAARCPTTPPMMEAVPPPDVERETPVLPVRAYVATTSRATLTLLTGMNAGHLVSVDASTVTIGRGPDGGDFVVDDPGVSRRHARVGRGADGGFYLEDLGSTNGTFVGGGRVGVSILRGGEIVQLGPTLLMRFAIVGPGEESLHRRLYDSATHDPLTRIYNRLYFADRLVVEIAQARRSGGELALLIADVDSLKHVNDTFGHLAGDRALCVIGARIKRTMRAEDVLARYGGDEFIIVAPGTGLAEAQLLGERIRRAVESLRMSARKQNAVVTLSIGGAALGEVAPTDPGVGLIALADGRLYRAKESGRNRVCTASP